MAEGTLLAGRYAHLRELGRGASGRVLLAEDRLDGATRAIKIVSGADGERLRWERALLGSLAHPNLARVHELLTITERVAAPWSLEPGAVALVEEHVDGPTAGVAAAGLEDLEARVRFAVRVGGAVARALGAIHAAGLVHQDVKPGNIVVPEDPERSRLIDLGLCRPPGVSSSVSGTLGFLAPEALLGERSPTTDLYALGATLHALLVGRTAFDTEGSQATLAEALARRPRVDELPADVPLAVRRLVGDLLAERADERPDAAREVVLRLVAIAAELGLDVAPEASLADSSRGLERAARASVRPLVGRAAELRALEELLAEGGVIAVVGSPGVGRSRLIREAARALQTRRSLERASVPTFVADAGDAVPRVEHDAVVHLQASVDWEACRFAVEAAGVQRLGLAVVVEAEDRVAVPEGVPTVAVGPLDDAALRALVGELLEVDPSGALVSAARAASGGLPGRLVRLVAEGFEAGLDPARPATLEDLGRQHGDAAVVPALARPLAEALVVAGGALASAPAQALFDDAEAMARALLGAGVAHVDARGRVRLREDVRRDVVVSASRRAALAKALEPLDLDPLARAHVHLASGRPGRAAEAFLSRMRVARDAGDPERAAALGTEALGVMEEPPAALRLETADALRACAREARALEVLADMDEPAAIAARADLARLSGDLARAEAEARATDHPDAATVRARIALGRGDLEGALAAIEGVSAPAGASEARAHEIRVFVALARGRFDDASRAARDSSRAAQRADSLAASARAASVEGAVLQARGLVQDAAACFERAFELADRAGERYAAASYLVNVGLGRLERGAAGPATDALREGARRLTELGRRRDATRALYNLANAAAVVGDDVVARSAVRRAREWAEALGDSVASGLAAVVEADLAVRAGKLELATRVLEEGFATAADVVKVTVGARLALTLAIRGEVAAARASLTAIEGLAADRVGEVERAIAAARVALAAGEPAAAAERSSEGLARAEGAGWECQLRAALSGAESFEHAGRSEEARASLGRARELLDAAAATLGPHARARLRAVPAYQRALTAAPAGSPRPRSDRHRVLARHAKRLVREPRLSRLHEAIVDAAVELADAERGFLVRRGPDGELKVLAARAFGADLVGESPSTSVATRVFDSARPLVTVDALQDDRLDAAASVHQMALRSVLAVPLPLDGASATAIVLDDRLRPAAFDRDVVEVISDLAELAAGAVQRAEALRAQRREARRLALEKRRLSERVETAEQELSALRQRADDVPAFEGIVAESEPMRRVLHLVGRVAPSDAPVLVLGESGTGKELVARAVHEASPRRDGAYVSENCSAIPESLLESALFGHVRGAFTGADRARRGLFEIADGGTLFLDEIGEMSEPMQAKLLRVLQDGELRPIGSEHTRKVDVRLVAATHRDLPALVDGGRFRRDLFYRIAVVQVELPPLRERPDDVPPLVAAFLERHAPDRAVRIEPQAMRALRAHRWPGNVRELENEIRRALVLADDVVTTAHLSPSVRGEGESEPVDELDLKRRVAALERRLIRRAMETTGGNQTRAASLLGLSRYGLQKMIKRLGIE
ncbi:MAG: sigma 54-interacting transcriptional regulator [Sandaracinaceae bacterium]|nr:sigma 54-interacting transcriptional regulator [Sandaracinaceae bacterium]